MNLKAPKNANYACTVVVLRDFVDLPNCDNVKAAIIFGNSVIVSKDAKVGDLGLFFPVETQIMKEFLGANNQFRKPEFGNVDPTAKGFFDNSGRVKAVKFRGHKSEGFFIGIQSLSYLSISGLKEGDTFDELDGHKICQKYIVYTPKEQVKTEKGKKASPKDRIADNQFRFHFDTENLRRNIHKINPDDEIVITDKWHGTSVVISKLLTIRHLPFYERILDKLGVKVQKYENSLIHSSRRVIKGVGGEKKEGKDYYGEDIWGIVASEVHNKIPNGYSLYGEIVGWTPEGKAIQEHYTYSCQPKTHRFIVYRITITNSDGFVAELDWSNVLRFCNKFGLETVPTLWMGVAKHLFPELDTKEHWHENFLKALETEYVHDQDCPYNPGKPSEGICVRIEGFNECSIYKLKNFRFLEHESKELDKGIIDLETVESTGEEECPNQSVL